MIKKFFSFRLVELPVECLPLYPFSAWYSPLLVEVCPCFWAYSMGCQLTQCLLHGHFFEGVSQWLPACALAVLAWEKFPGITTKSRPPEHYWPSLCYWLFDLCQHCLNTVYEKLNQTPLSHLFGAHLEEKKSKRALRHTTWKCTKYSLRGSYQFFLGTHEVFQKRRGNLGPVVGNDRSSPGKYC